VELALPLHRAVELATNIEVYVVSSFLGWTLAGACAPAAA